MSGKYLKRSPARTSPGVYVLSGPAHWSRTLRNLLHTWTTGDLEPPLPDVQVQVRLGKEGDRERKREGGRKRETSGKWDRLARPTFTQERLGGAEG